jgi:hypothetical protein
MSGGQTATTTQNSSPQPFLAPYAQYGAQQAAQQYASPAPQYYPGGTVAAQSPATQAAQQAAIGYGMSGNPVSNAAGGYLQNVLGGQYARAGNPYLGAVDKSLAASIVPQVDAQFSLAGRYGSPAQAGTMTTALANAEAPYHYGDYQQERANQQSAAGMAPTYDTLEQQRIGALQGAGQSMDTQAQNLINANVARWGYNQSLAQQKLGQFMNLLFPSGFGQQSTSTQTAPSGGIPGFLGGILGGLLG